jgi:hypothetical protein
MAVFAGRSHKRLHPQNLQKSGAFASCASSELKFAGHSENFSSLALPLQF